MESESTCKNDDTTKQCTCLHCGSQCNGNYCYNCGQSTSTSRLTAKTFFAQSVNGIFRINSVFLVTIFRLFFTPWVVIGGYIKGHRVCYTPPIVMTVLLFFFMAIIESFMPPTPVPQISLMDLYHSDGFHGIFIFLLSCLSPHKMIFCYLMFPPIIVAIKIAYCKRGADKYTWAEYAFAAFYSICSLVIATDLLLLLRLIFGIEIGMLLIVYSVIMFILMLWKAFPCKSVGVSIGRLVIMFLYSIVFYGMYLGFFCGMLYLLLKIME